MIPILYGQNETEFETTGLGFMSDMLSCTVTEERNGAYELEAVYPSGGIRAADISVGCIILAQPGPNTRSQPFRIYYVAPSSSGTIKIRAEHISYQLSSIPCSPFSAESAADALAGIKSHAAVDVPFNFWTDISSTARYNQNIPESIRARLGGVDGSILDTYGGEFEWDRYDVKLHAARGADNGVTIEYGKDLVSLEQEKNMSGALTGVYPYYYKDGEYVETSDKVILTESQNLAYPHIKCVDFTEMFDDGVPDLALLEYVARDYIRSNGLDRPKVSFSIDFVQLSQTMEYASYVGMKSVRLCDYITVVFPKMGVNAKAKVTKAVYDVLRDRHKSISVGDAKQGIAETVSKLAQGRLSQSRWIF